MYNLRHAEPKDIPRILELYDELSITMSNVEAGKDPGAEEYARVLDQIDRAPEHQLLVVDDGTCVVGTLVLLIVPNLSHRASPWVLLENLMVDEGFRGKGLGRMLIDHAISKARDARCYKIVLMSDTRREDAHRFYRHMGFEASAYGFRMYL